MASLVVSVKQGDTAPPFAEQLRERNGPPVNLAGCSARFVMAPVQTDTPTVSAPATITDAAQGRVEYRWGATDLAEPGRYWAEVVITDADGKVRSFPADRYFWVKVMPDLDP